MRSWASAAVYLNSSVFCVITQRRLVKHWRFGTTYRSHLHTWPLTIGPIGCPETSVLSQPTLRDSPEDGRILVGLTRGESIPKCILFYFVLCRLCLKIHVNIILPSTSGFSKWSFFPHQHPLCISPVPHTCHPSHPYYPFDLITITFGDWTI